nr:ATP-binding protein [uncultured Desulfuromonas sp.]
MKLTISHRLFLALFLAATLSAFSLMVLTQWNLNRGLLRMVQEIEQEGAARLAGVLEASYATVPGWRALQEDETRWRELVLLTLHDEAPEDEPVAGKDTKKEQPRRGVPPHLIRYLSQRFCLLDADGRQLAGPLLGEEPRQRLALIGPKGTLVGYLSYIPTRRVTDYRHLHFLKDQRQAFIAVMLLVVVISAGLSVLLARRLLRPVRQMAMATHRLRRGDFSSRVPGFGRDELGQLARDFNALAMTLERNEQDRRQWVADISHELRTPVGILRGEIEALLDGIRPLDEPALLSLHGETLRLGRLIDDLYQLSMSDLGALSYRKQELNLVELVADVVESYQHAFAERDLDLDVEMPGEAPAWLVLGDDGRLRQLFANVLDNALKYTDPGGRVRVRLRRNEDGRQVVEIDDSAPGVAPADLPRLFDRLFRVEHSRNRRSGGAGLGLTICRNIAEAHEGMISARLSELGGVQIRVVLPGLGEG